MYKRGLWLVVAALLVVLLLAGCKDDKTADDGQAADKPADTTASQTGDQVKPRPAKYSSERSLFIGTPMESEPPATLALNHDCTEIAFKVMNMRSREIYVRGLRLEDGAFTASRDYFSAPDLIQDAIVMHPSRMECLTGSIAQEAGGPVHDLLWKLNLEDRRLVPYDQAEGFSYDWHPSNYAQLQPCYSWDGETILVPLKRDGLVVIESTKEINKYLPYPEFEGLLTGVNCQALPDEEGKRRAYISLWQSGTGEADHCSLCILDLDTLEWERVVEVKYPVHAMATSDLEDAPWVISCSRPPTGAEPARVPLLGLLDPDSGFLKLTPVGGEPLHDLELDPTGQYAVYLDSVRKAIVRVDLHSDMLDIDPGYYHKDATLFIGPGGDPVIAWHRADFVIANFTELANISE